jgi:peptidylprolyl isomerase
MSKQELAALPSLTIARQDGPPPKHLTVIDLRKGTGRAVTKQDAILVRFFDVKYGEAAKESRTGLYGPTKFGMNEVVKGWELGLPGMRVGGRRELIVPPKLGYRGWTLIYVVDLIAIEPGGAGNV